MTQQIDRTSALGLAPEVDVPLRTSRPRWERRYAALLPLADLLVLVVSGTAAWLVRGVHPGVSAVLSVAWLVALASGGAYESRMLGQGSDEYKRVLSSSWHFAALLALGAYAVDAPGLRGFLYADLPVGAVLLLLGRQTVRRYVWARRRKGFALKRLVVVGPAFAAADMIRDIGSREDTGFQVVGVCTGGLVADGMSSDPYEDLAAIGDFGDVVQTVATARADTVAVVGAADMPTGFIRSLAWQLEGSGVDLLVSPAITDVAGPRIHVRPVANLPLLYVEAPQFTGAQRVLKSATDRLFAAVLLLVAAPLMVSVAVAVKVTSRGPVFFRQQRLGRDGRAFAIWKFRTMQVGAEHLLAGLHQRNESDGSLFKIRADPRITPLGRALRRLSLDELPQLVNVVLGQMSLVGPRPLPVALEDVDVTERRRLLVRPGITGLWQVSGRSDLSWDESVRIDLYYVENWSLALDVIILARTLIAVLRRQGAY